MEDVQKEKLLAVRLRWVQEVQREETGTSKSKIAMLKSFLINTPLKNEQILNLKLTLILLKSGTSSVHHPPNLHHFWGFKM